MALLLFVGRVGASFRKSAAVRRVCDIQFCSPGDSYGPYHPLEMGRDSDNEDVSS